MANSAPVMWMRGGTSKGGYFLAGDLPADPGTRDAFLFSVMGSPDPRQIDGMGGADPLTSKVAVVRKSDREGIDVDYLFLQVFVDQAIVSDAQNCGNILAGIFAAALGDVDGPFIECCEGMGIWRSASGKGDIKTFSFPKTAGHRNVNRSVENNAEGFHHTNCLTIVTAGH